LDVRFVVSSNTKEVAERISKRIKRLQEDGKSVVRDVSEFGKYYAQSIAPNDTGATIRATKWTKGKTPASATIVFGNGHPETRSRLGVSFTKYMNTVPRNSAAYNHFRKDREPHFIQATVDEVRKRFGKGMRRVVNRF
jgi:hypothetical protein